jgi:hypothetical protein
MTFAMVSDSLKQGISTRYEGSCGADVADFSLAHLPDFAIASSLLKVAPIRRRFGAARFPRFQGTVLEC